MSRALDSALERQGNRCFYCGCILRAAGHPEINEPTRDHFIPRLAGGSESHANSVAACGGCNTTKGGRMPTIAEIVRFVELLCVDPQHLTARTGPLTAGYRYRAAAALDRALDRPLPIRRSRRRRAAAGAPPP